MYGIYRPSKKQVIYFRLAQSCSFILHVYVPLYKSLMLFIKKKNFRFASICILLTNGYFCCKSKSCHMHFTQVKLLTMISYKTYKELDDLP